MSTINIVTIETRRTGYNIDQVINKTMTIGELIEILRGFNSNDKVIFSNDGGYTYGEIDEIDIKDRTITTSTEKRIATDVEWDINPDDYDDIEEYEEVDCSLPSEVEIPDDVTDDEIADYLADEYGTCIIGYTLRKEK